MKCFIKILSIFIFIGLLSGTAYSEVLDGYDKELLNTPQADEITLQPRSNTLFAGENSPAAKSVETKVIETKFVETKPVQTDNNILNDDNEVMNNNELEFEFFRMFDKDNDNVIDEDTVIGKVLHSKIVRTDVPSYLFKDDLTFKFKEGSPVNKVQLYGVYRGSIGSIFNESNYSTEYENLSTQIGVIGSLKNPDYRFKFSINPVQSSGEYFDQFISNAYIMNTSIPHHQITAGYTRIQIGMEGGTSTQILPFVARSQIARNFGNAKSLAVKLAGNYQYIDYNFSVGSSGRYITSGMPGAEFNGWVNLKPLGHKAKKYGKVTTGGSDAHKPDCVGRGYTILPEPVTCETELISLIHKKTPFKAGGTLYEKTTKEKIGKVNKLLVYSFWVYNKSGELIKRRGRNKKMEEEHPFDPIDPIELYYHS